MKDNYTFPNSIKIIILQSNTNIDYRRQGRAKLLLLSLHEIRAHHGS